MFRHPEFISLILTVNNIIRMYERRIIRKHNPIIYKFKTTIINQTKKKL